MAAKCEPQRTVEGWVLVQRERRCEDPHRFDDCWHRGEYTRYTVPGTDLVIEADDSDPIGSGFDRLRSLLQDAGLHGTIEMIGDLVGIGYRQIHTIKSRAEEEADRAEYERFAASLGPCDYDGADRGL